MIRFSTPKLYQMKLKFFKNSIFSRLWLWFCGEVFWRIDSFVGVRFWRWNFWRVCYGSERWSVRNTLYQRGCKPRRAWFGHSFAWLLCQRNQNSMEAWLFEQQANGTEAFGQVWRTEDRIEHTVARKVINIWLFDIHSINILITIWQIYTL